MKYVLDTNVCINLIKGRPISMLKKIETISVKDVLIPEIVRFELFYGAYKSVRKKETLSKLKDFLNSFESIDFNSKVAEIAGKIRAELDKKGTPIGPYDLLIGATALMNRYILVTHNTKEFSRISGLNIEDWEE